MVSREDKARICEMYANGCKQKVISSTFCVSIRTVRRIISVDYRGYISTRTPVLLTLQSKV